MAGKIKRIPLKYTGDKAEASKALVIAVGKAFSAGLKMHEVIAIVWSKMINRALQRCYGNQTQAAEELAISRTTLTWYLRKEKADAETKVG
jgi:DNA-binding NtrC family response regulator